MHVDVKRMIDTALIKPATRCQLGHSGTDELGIAKHRVSPMTGRKNALELNTHTLTRHGIEQRRALGKRTLGLGLNHKVQTAGKAHRTQHAQGVLVKATLGIADSANQLALQVTLAVVAVDKPALGMPGHGIDGKVAARQIVLERGGTLHTLGMTTIGVKAIQTVRGDLDTLAIGNSRDSAKFNARLHNRDAGGLERRFGLLPQAATAHINIVAGVPHQGVAHPTAHVPSLKTSRLKRAQDAQGRIGRLSTVERNIAHAYGLLRLSNWLSIVSARSLARNSLHCTRKSDKQKRIRPSLRRMRNNQTIQTRCRN